jgi:hypothetical protein
MNGNVTVKVSKGDTFQSIYLKAADKLAPHNLTDEEKSRVKTTLAKYTREIVTKFRDDIDKQDTNKNRKLNVDESVIVSTSFLKNVLKESNLDSALVSAAKNFTISASYNPGNTADRSDQSGPLNGTSIIGISTSIDRKLSPTATVSPYFNFEQARGSSAFFDPKVAVKSNDIYSQFDVGIRLSQKVKVMKLPVTFTGKAQYTVFNADTPMLRFNNISGLRFSLETKVQLPNKKTYFSASYTKAGLGESALLGSGTRDDLKNVQNPTDLSTGSWQTKNYNRQFNLGSATLRTYPSDFIKSTFLKNHDIYVEGKYSFRNITVNGLPKSDGTPNPVDEPLKHQEYWGGSIGGTVVKGFDLSFAYNIKSSLTNFDPSTQTNQKTFSVKAVITPSTLLKIFK